VENQAVEGNDPHGGHRCIHVGDKAHPYTCCISFHINTSLSTQPSFIPPAYEDGTDKSVPKCWHIKFRHRGITHKKAYNIQNTAKV